MNIIDNRRDVPRISTLFSVDVAGDSGHFAVDVGTGGLRLVAQKPLVEDELEFRLHLPSDREVTIVGRPVWQQQMSANGRTMAGISFSTGQDEAQEALRTWLETYRPN